MVRYCVALGSVSKSYHPYFRTILTKAIAQTVTDKEVAMAQSNTGKETAMVSASSRSDGYTTTPEEGHGRGQEQLVVGRGAWTGFYETIETIGLKLDPFVESSDDSPALEGE